ncbi:transcriptional regulator (Xre family) [Liquorilactobacillus vini DSM 20605]|uniref:Transcriptional regulator (Xre family) n=2 Tax=Lactobacillaceae TaxID=33958 RepID=A0A0R2BYB7_9LACO|nr:transcriptional regulator (Xre family) [Liquorilactobacillus vini DSM 20605]
MTMELNLILKQERQKLHLTQEQLAEKIFVSPKTVSNWETGKTFPDIESLIKLAQLYHLSLDKLLVEGSDIVKDIEKKTRLTSLKKYMWGPNILNLILIIMVSQQQFLGKLSLLSTVLLLISIVLNGITLLFFSKEIHYEERQQEVYKPFNKPTTRLLIFTIIFVGAIVIGYFIH